MSDLAVCLEQFGVVGVAFCLATTDMEVLAWSRGKGTPSLQQARLLSVMRSAIQGGKGLLWFFLPHPALDERPPAVVLLEDPERVLAISA